MLYVSNFKFIFEKKEGKNMTGRGLKVPEPCCRNIACVVPSRRKTRGSQKSKPDRNAPAYGYCLVTPQGQVHTRPATPRASPGSRTSRCLCQVAWPGSSTPLTPAEVAGVGHQCPLLVTLGTARLCRKCCLLSTGSPCVQARLSLGMNNFPPCEVLPPQELNMHLRCTV